MQPYESFWPQEVSVGEVIYPPGGTLGPRYQKTLQLVLLYSGHMRLQVDGMPREVGPKSMCILLPEHEEYFAFDTSCETHHSWVHIALPDFPPELLTRLQQLAWPLPLSPQMTQFMREALMLQKMSFSTSQEMLKSLGLLMLWRYIGEGERAFMPSISSPPTMLVQAQQFILTHLQEPIMLQQIAQASAVSPFHLIRLFQKHLSLTPIAYLWQQRIAEGIKLLEQTGLPIGTIAYQCGFQSRHHFSRRIRQETGFTPQEVPVASGNRAQRKGECPVFSRFLDILSNDQNGKICTNQPTVETSSLENALGNSHSSHKLLVQSFLLPPTVYSCCRMRALSRSLRSRRRILPEAVLGIALMNSIKWTRL